MVEIQLEMETEERGEKGEADKVVNAHNTGHCGNPRCQVWARGRGSEWALAIKGEQ